MFEAAELGHRVSKAEYARAEPVLREALLRAQYALGETRPFAVVILSAGIDGAGRREAVNLLNTWMDPRFISVHGMGTPSDEEAERPPMWRFWRRLPAKGEIGIFLGSWYTQPLLDRVYRRIGSARYHEAIEQIEHFERMLCDEGVLLLKFWFHLSKQRQRVRLKDLEADPKTRWRVTEQDWRNFARYDRFHEASEQAIRMTNRAHATWTIIDGSEARFRSLAMGRALLEALERRLAEARVPVAQTQAPRSQAPALPSPTLAAGLDNRHILNALDLAQRIKHAAYLQQLESLQGRLNLLTRHKAFHRISVVVLFEGNDAAGKGGAIRRITGALDARFYHVIPVAAPTEEERAHPYLWRFWRHLPQRGHFAIFDRSWYGRILVERVEAYCAEADWQRAYGEINDFEEQMAEQRIVVVKFWLAISQDEQLVRFKAREATDFKRYKITPDDWRNRERWDDYAAAVCDMVERTGTTAAPWTLVEANDKYFARVKVLTTLCERIEAELEAVVADTRKVARKARPGR